MQIRQIALAAVAVAAASVAQARDGDFYKSFGNGGREQIAFSPSLYLQTGFVDFVDIAIQSDGKLVVGATVDNTAAPTPSDDMGLLRLNPNGTVDTNFGTQGQTFVDFALGGANDDVFSSVLVQPNGRIVSSGAAGGSPTAGGADMAVSRLLATGAPDTQFSGDGKATIPFDIGPVGNRDDVAVRCAIQSDGKIVAAGRATIDANSQRMAVVRLNADGSRDTSFNGSGTATIDFGPSLPIALAFDVKIQPDGRILLTGAVSTSANAIQWGFARLTSSGQLDTTFGNGGTLAFDAGLSSYKAYEALSALVLADGSIVAVGIMALQPDLTNFDYGIFKLHSDGSLDTTFGDGGGKVFAFDLGGSFTDAPVKVLQDSRGRFVMGGFSTTGDAVYTNSIARLMPDGQLDPSFGVGGKLAVSSTIPPAVDFGEQGTTIALGADDSILIGSIADFDATPHTHIGLVKLIGDTIFSNGFEAE